MTKAKSEIERRKKKPMTKVEFEGSKADKIADEKALKKINAKRSGRG